MHSKHISAAASPISHFEVLLFNFFSTATLQIHSESLQTQASSSSRENNEHKSMYQIALKCVLLPARDEMIGETLMEAGENNSLSRSVTYRRDSLTTLNLYLKRSFPIQFDSISTR